MGSPGHLPAGSVGKPKDADPRACVSLVVITKDAVVTNSLRVPYDMAKTTKAIVARGLPAYFADRLKGADRMIPIEQHTGDYPNQHGLAFITVFVGVLSQQQAVQEN